MTGLKRFQHIALTNVSGVFKILIVICDYGKINGRFICLVNAFYPMNQWRKHVFYLSSAPAEVGVIIRLQEPMNKLSDRKYL